MVSASVIPQKRLRSVSPASSTTSIRSTLRGNPKSLSVESIFAPGLFNRVVELKQQHSDSAPYKFCKIDELVSDSLLRRVRREITTQLHFTEKETDIYRVHQTGDLLNLSGLSSKEKEKLKGLQVLRDAMYSTEFRKFISDICQCGPLSGIKQDMSINCYAKGSHLLTHDDVIGSRRVSYILYLPDPNDKDCTETVTSRSGAVRNAGWQAEWGGSLRLYKTEKKNMPEPDFDLVVPPAWNQLVFFVVQPGISFHDVEEVLADKPRLAISGWFHLPQKGEEGYVEGLEQKLNRESSRAQLADAAAATAAGYGEAPVPYLQRTASGAHEFSRAKALLSTYFNENLLRPDSIALLKDQFADNSLIEIENFLNEEFARKLQAYIESQEKKPVPITCKLVSEDKDLAEWKVSRPPHKHRYMFQEPKEDTTTPIEELTKVLNSNEFKAWLSEICSLGRPTHGRVLARRFRPGCDYTLATTGLGLGGEDGTEVQVDSDDNGIVEADLCITPSSGWSAGNFGGYELYMDDGGSTESSKATGDFENLKSVSDNEDSDVENDPAVYLSGSRVKRAKQLERLRAESESRTNGFNGSSEGEEDAGDGKDGAKMVYNDELEDGDDTGEEEDEEDGDDSVLHTSPVSWNTMTIVLRDPSVLKFVKYVSHAAPGSRWDISTEWRFQDQSEIATAED
ncbi:Oxoglutarate and iron-dependent oxygenase degradation C-term-domain-containing protein [Dipodascopsis uninucleata]